MNTTPKLDFRNQDIIYQQTLELARAYCPEWVEFWPPDLQSAVNDDPGLVLLNLFSELMNYTIQQENNLPVQRRLAFFQFLALAPRAPVAADCILQFQLRKNSKPVKVPAFTTVTGEQQPPIRFQTQKPLQVIPANIVNAFSLFPSLDSYVNSLPLFSSEQSSTMFIGKQPYTEQQPQPAIPLGHWFILGDSNLFAPDDSLQSISVVMHGRQLAPVYFEQWYDGDLNAMNALVTADSSGSNLTATLATMPSAPAMTLTEFTEKLFIRDGGINSFDMESDESAITGATKDYWLTVTPAPGMKILSKLEDQLPYIKSIYCQFSGKKIQPNTAAYNNVQVDTANGVYPFGQTPETSDAFAISSVSVFAKEGALVTVNFDLMPVEKAFPVELDWQFWNGDSWQSFTNSSNSQYQFVDECNNLQANNSSGGTYIRFLCPALQQHTVAGEKGLWIRVVIESGGYGKEGGFVTTSVADTLDQVPSSILDPQKKADLIDHLNKTQGVNFSYHFNRSHFYPPFIKALTVTYEFQTIPQQFFCYNAFELSDFLFKPYVPLQLDASSFYLGLSPADIQKYCLGEVLTLFFNLPQSNINNSLQQIEKRDPAAIPAQLQWQYYNGNSWVSLDVDDNTHQMTTSGIVSFVVPQDITPGIQYSRYAVWLRVKDLGIGRDIELLGVYPNSVLAANKITITDEILGSSNGVPEQQFQLDNTPVMEGMTLLVNEPESFSEKVSALQQNTNDTVSNNAVPTGSRKDKTTPVVWQQVPNFAFSDASSRVYTLDNQTGKITFGDGRNGLIPPQGHNNIVASQYSYTQGLQGNVAADVLNTLKPGISNITAVSNPAPASGGVEGDDTTWLSNNGPALLRANNNAVQLNDFEALALDASPLVDKAIACTVEQPVSFQPLICIYLLPISTDPAPQPSLTLLLETQQHLRDRCLLSLADNVRVYPPDYVAIDVTIQLVSNEPQNQHNQQRLNITQDIATYLQPVFGGNTKLGWQFGASITARDISLYTQTLEGVEVVLAVTINGHTNGEVLLNKNQLPMAGDIEVQIYGGLN